MKIKYYEFEIVGMTPMLLNRFQETSEVEKETRKVRLQTADDTPRDIASRAAHRLPTGEFFLPGSAVALSLAAVASGHKQRGTRKSLKYVIPASVLVRDEALVLRDPTNGAPLTDFEVDSRPVVIPATKGRVMRHRPRFEKWMIRGSLQINTELIGVDTVAQLLGEAGIQNGLGDFRPQRFGPFGTFRISSFQEQNEAEAAE